MGNSGDLLDIIIINYNSTDYLLGCLRSIYDSLQELPAKVIVQDNASEDGVDRVKSEFPQVMLSKNSYNIGFAKAINNALRQSDSPYIILLNPDTYVIDSFFEAVLRYMEEHPHVGIVGPKILNHDGSVQGSARTFPTPLTGLFGRSSLISRFFPNNPFTRANILTTRSDGKTPMEVDWLSGACMAVRRKALDDVGLLDERFFMYWEDADWCRRMWRKGGKVVYFPQASVVHYVGVSRSIVYDSPISVYYSHRNLEWVYIKNMPSNLIPKTIWLHIIYDIAAFVFFSANGRMKEFIRAKWDAIKGTKRMLKKRRLIQKMRSVDDTYIWGLLEKELFIPRLTRRLRKN